MFDPLKLKLSLQNMKEEFNNSIKLRSMLNLEIHNAKVLT